MKSVFILTLSILILSIPSIAQIDIRSSKYIFNPMYFNPANTGVNDETELTYSIKSGLRFRSEEIPNKEILSVSAPIKGERWRIGVSAMHQDFFLINYLMIKPSAAWYFSFNGGQSLISLGLSTSFTKLKVDELLSTPIIPEQNKYYSNLDLGVFYKSQFGYLGFSGRDLVKRKIDVTNVDGEEMPLLTLDRYLSLNGGINCLRFKHDLLVVRPSFSLDRVISEVFTDLQIVQVELNLEFEIYERFNLGGAYRNNDAFNNILFNANYIDVWLGYKDREKKFILITNWDIEESNTLDRFTAELVFGYIFNRKESPIKMIYHFF